MKRIASGTMVTLLFVGVFVSTFDIQEVKASGTIYIKADGNVDPSTAPIERDGDIYTFISNIYDGIVVERSNITVDGKGYRLQGSGAGYGFYLSNVNNVTIRNVNIKYFFSGICLYSSSFDTIYRNKMTSNLHGIELHGFSDENKIYENNVTDNNLGIWVCIALNNAIYHNNFVNNTRQFESQGDENIWDEGYPSGGNYWSDYIGTDSYSGPSQNLPGSDGIGDTPYIVDAFNRDRYPLMMPYLWGVRDIGITSIIMSTVVGQECTAKINVMVINYGDFTENFEMITNANKTVIQKRTAMLTSRTSATITFTWDTSGFAKGNYIIDAYAEPVLGETDAADNTFIDGWVFVTISGDVNGDKTVNILDCILLANHWGHKNRDGHTPNTKPWLDCMNCDINNDGIVNILDAIKLSNNFGQKWA